jgi:hypothetical protein
MNILQKLFGSKYNKDLPYTYHAKRQVFQGDDDITVDWVSDTICGLCNYLKKKKEDPTEITIYECFQGKEKELPKDLYINSNSKWRPKKELCSMHQRYGSAGTSDKCEFQDRSKKTITCS